MITEDRMQELIDMRATVYVPKTFEDGCYEIKLMMHHFIAYADNKISLKGRDGNGEVFLEEYLEDIYEDKNEALWNKEFVNIERVSTLSLPYWNEIVNDLTFGKCRGVFVVAEFDHYEISVIKSKDGLEKVCIGGSIKIKDEPATEEGYRKICEFAKKLFLER